MTVESREEEVWKVNDAEGLGVLSSCWRARGEAGSGSEQGRKDLLEAAGLGQVVLDLVWVRDCLQALADDREGPGQQVEVAFVSEPKHHGAAHVKGVISALEHPGTAPRDGVPVPMAVSGRMQQIPLSFSPFCSPPHLMSPVL